MVALPDVENLIDGARAPASSGEWLDKLRPSDGTLLCRVARSGEEDVLHAVAAARAAQPAWAERTAVERGDLVRDLALLLRERRQEASELVGEETGKPLELALGETDAAVEMGLFVAGEGRRSYGRTTTASMAHRTVLTVRQPPKLASGRPELIDHYLRRQRRKLSDRVNTTVAQLPFPHGADTPEPADRQ